MTTSDQTAAAYREKLLMALRVRDVPGERIGEVLAEVEAHVAETGEDPTEAFGPPRAYADQVVGVTGRSGRWRLDPRVALVSLLVAVATFVATSWTVGGVVALAGDGATGPFGTSPGLELALGLLVGAVVLTFLVRWTRRMEDPVVDPRTGRPTDTLAAWVPPTVMVTVFVLCVVLAVVVDRLTS